MKTLYTTPKFLTKNILKALCQIPLLLISVFAFAEGTAQLTPTAASDNQGVIQLWDNNDVNRNSSTFGCPDTKRLFFNICNPEEVYFGMNYETGDLTGGATLW